MIKSLKSTHGCYLLTSESLFVFDAIIDQRAYRLITPAEDSLNIPYNIDKEIELYFNYIHRLKSVCTEYGIPFSEADKILYQLDKKENKKIHLTNYA